MVVLGVGRFLMSEVPLYQDNCYYLCVCPHPDLPHLAPREAFVTTDICYLLLPRHLSLPWCMPQSRSTSIETDRGIYNFQHARPKPSKKLRADDATRPANKAFGTVEVPPICSRGVVAARHTPPTSHQKGTISRFRKG